jgi:acyl-CoA synthetase (NDP forming)
MACYGIPFLDTQLATNAQQAENVARDFGFPVVMKATRPGLVHKTEAGGVRLGLSDASAVRAAYLSIADSLDEAEPEVALQPMVQTGVELVVGVVHNALFGSLVMVGLGGVHTDVLGDRSFRSLPLTDQDAAAMWRELRAAPLLTGYRGAPAVDTDALEQLILRVAALAEDFPEVSELDLNPVVAVLPGCGSGHQIKLAPAKMNQMRTPRVWLGRRASADSITALSASPVGDLSPLRCADFSRHGEQEARNTRTGKEF